MKCQASDGTEGWPLVLPGGPAPPWQTSYQAPEASPALGGEGKGTGQPSSPSAGRRWDPLGCSSEVGALLYFEVHRKVAGRHRAWGLQDLLPGVRATVLCLQTPRGLAGQAAAQVRQAPVGHVTEGQNRSSRVPVSTWKPWLVCLVCRSSRLESVTSKWSLSSVPDDSVMQTAGGAGEETGDPRPLRGVSQIVQVG